MKVTIVVAALAFAAYAAAAPSSSPVHIDVYRNLLAPANRILGGENAQKGEFPYQISLHWEMFPGYKSHICGGSVLDSTTVVTAGHCYAYDFGVYYVVAGLLKQSNIDGDVQEIEVEDFIVHEGYPGGVAPNDIGILKLKKPLILNEAVQAARLPTEEECNAIETSTLSGWGLTSQSSSPPDHLQRADLPRITNDQCASDLTAILGHAGPLDSTMICSSTNEGQNQSACSGDSGGPLVLKDSKSLVGVVSWGISPCGTKGAPSVYTRVCTHLSFIQKHMG